MPEGYYTTLESHMTGGIKYFEVEFSSKSWQCLLITCYCRVNGLPCAEIATKCYCNH